MCLYMYVCMQVCMYKCPSQSATTICQIDFKLVRCVPDDPRMCMCAFGAVWMHESFNINKNLGILLFICVFFCLSRQWAKTRTAPFCHWNPYCGWIWDCFRRRAVYCYESCMSLSCSLQPCYDRGQDLTSAIHNIHGFAFLLKCEREGR